MFQELHATIYGDVQGVGFRATTCQIARKLNLKGIVRNASSGTVEIIAQGEKRDLDDLLVKLEKEFRVDRIEKKFFF